MKLILVRHGESARNRGYPVSAKENNLTTVGVGQAVEAARILAKKNFDVVYCSPAARCEQTLDEILRVKDEGKTIHICALIGPKRKKEKLVDLKRRIELFVDDLK